MAKEIDVQEYMGHALELMKWFQERNIPPAESLLVVAALNCAFMVEARLEGREADVITYTQIYKEGLEIFLPIIEHVASNGGFTK